MHNGIAATILGSTAAVLSAIAFVPQIKKTWTTGGKDLSYFMLSLYVAGVTLWLCYGLAIGAMPLSLANAASIVFAGTCLLLKFIKDKQRAAGTENKRLRIAIDMDETIADSLTEHIRRYNAAFPEKITANDLCGKHLEEFVPLDRTDSVRRMIRDEVFFDCLGVIEEAQEVIRDLVREHEVFIVSAAMEIPESFAAKHRWLRRHFPFISASNIVFCGDKGIIDADYLIDDEARHFSNFRGIGVLFSAPHNLNETGDERVANWQGVRRKLLGLKTNRDLDEAGSIPQTAVSRVKDRYRIANEKSC